MPIKVKRSRAKRKPTVSDGKRSSKAVFEARVNDVFGLLVNGASKQDLILFASQNGWHVSERQIANYVKAATERIKAAAALDRETELGRAVARLHDLYSSALNISDYKTALAVQKEMHALLGLNAPEKIRVEHTLNDEERASRVASLLDTARARRDGRADRDGEFVQ